MGILAPISSSAAIVGNNAGKVLNRGLSLASKAARGVHGVVKSVNHGITKTRERFDHGLSRVTGVDYGWSRAILSVGSAASLVGNSRLIRVKARSWLHPDYSSHPRVFRQINQAIDSVRGPWHRIFGGHSIEWLPSLVCQFGLIAIPAYVIHLTQDFTTAQGIPLIPFANVVHGWLVSAGLSYGTAAAVLSVNAAHLVALIGTGIICYEVACLLAEIYRQKIASPSIA
jgi:hypothetical protein